MWHAWERRETCVEFWWESSKEKDHLKDQGVDGRMGSKWTVWLGGVEGIHLAQNRDRWRDLVNAVINPRVLAPRGSLVSYDKCVSRYGGFVEKIDCICAYISPMCYLL
jgi:hypothetical protein